ncbi:hypothetical protein ACRCPM_22315, partial [Pseudomonas aeruginosa]
MSYDSIFRPGLFDGQTIIVTGGGGVAILRIDPQGKA